MPPYILDAQCHNICSLIFHFLLLFLSIYLHFFVNENWVLGCPPGWMPGAVAPPAPRPLCTPLPVSKGQRVALPPIVLQA